MDPTAVTPRSRAPALEALRVNVVIGRAAANLSQAELALRAGLGRATLSRIESGSAAGVRIDAVQRLADALGTTVSDLFVPASADSVDEDEIERRAAAPASEFVNARALLSAVDEAAGRPTERRYSPRGRRSLVR